MPIARTRVKPETQREGATAIRGRSSPLGATISPQGVNFSVFSRSASTMELLLFDREDDDRPARVISFDPTFNRTYHYWHVFVPGVQAGQIYGFPVRCAGLPSRPGELLGVCTRVFLRTAPGV